MSAIDDNLTGKQGQAMELLLRGDTIENAARAAGVHRATLHRWLTTEPFMHVYAQRRRVLMDEAQSVLLAVGRTAAGAVLRIMGDDRVAPAVRLRAALAVLDLNQHWAELDDLTRRITELEARYEQAELERAGGSLNGHEREV